MNDNPPAQDLTLQYYWRDKQMEQDISACFGYKSMEKGWSR
jgi:hypothetical protein